MEKRLYRVQKILFNLGDSYNQFKLNHHGVTEYKFLKQVISYTGNMSDKAKFFSMLSSELDTYTTAEIELLEKAKKRYDVLYSLVERLEEQGVDNIEIEHLDSFVEGFSAALEESQNAHKYHIDNFALTKISKSKPSVPLLLSTITKKNGAYRVSQVPPIGDDYLILNGIGNLYMFYAYENSLNPAFVEIVHACLDASIKWGGLKLAEHPTLIFPYSSLPEKVTAMRWRKYTYKNEIIHTVFGVKYLIKNLTVHLCAVTYKGVKLEIYAYE